MTQAHYSLDYFVGDLQCPHCGETTQTMMHTYIRGEQTNLNYLEVGDQLQVPPTEDMVQLGYYLINEPAPNEDIRILESWVCEQCNTSGLWAVITISNNKIKSMEAVTLNKASLNNAHYISTESIGIAMELTDLSMEEVMKKDVVQLLREKLK